MANALDVAQYIYNQKGAMDPWKLEKLTYYAEAWSLGWYGRSLFDGHFEAWKDGPVQPYLFRVNKYDRSPERPTVLPGADLTQLSPLGIEVINAVLDFYGDMSTRELIERTHGEKPWLEARRGLPVEARSQEHISKSCMKRFYAAQEALTSSVPRRPILSATDSSVQDQRKLLQESSERWKPVLDILASC